MKIVVSFEGRVRPDSTGFYLLYALKSMGHEVLHVYPEDIFKINPGDADLFIKCDDGIYSKWNAELKPSHYFCIDSHIEVGFRQQIVKEGNFDTVSVVHSQGLSVDWGRDDVYWLPVACDPSIHYVGAREKRFDGCSIMNFHNNLAGPRVQALDGFFRGCEGPIFFGNRIFHEVSEKYAESRLVFNRSINGDANMRVFEALCSGSCLVTDRVPDMAKLGLIDGVHFAGFNGPGDVEELVRHLLAHPEEREAIAAAGRAEVLARHTYADRMKLLLEKLNLHEREKEHVHA